MAAYGGHYLSIGAPTLFSLHQWGFLYQKAIMWGIVEYNADAKQII